MTTAARMSPIETEIDIKALCEDGIAACRRGEWQEGVQILYQMVTTHWLADDVPSLAYSYLGYGRAYLGDGYREGLRLCKVGVKRGSYEPENYLNLARTCLLRDRRRLAVNVLERGLRVSPRNRALVKLRDSLGYRRPPVIVFLDRSHPLNRELGKLRHRLEQRRKP